MLARLKHAEIQKQQVSKSHKLHKAIGLLAKSSSEIQQVIERELLENPLLEEGDPGDDSVVEIDEGTDRIENIPDVPFDGQLDANIQWERYYHKGDSRWDHRSKKENEFPVHEKASVSIEQGLMQYLLWQLIFSKMNVVEKEIGSFVIGNIDDDGRLTLSAEEICQYKGYSLETVNQTIKKIQRFSPLGIAARDIKECLLIQIRASRKFKGSTAEWIIEKCWDQLKEKKYDDICKLLSCELSAVHSALSLISKLDPWPGRRFQDIVGEYKYAPNDTSLQINPEIFVYPDGDRHRLEFKDNFTFPTINPIYAEILNSDRIILKKVDLRKRKIKKKHKTKDEKEDRLNIYWILRKMKVDYHEDVEKQIRKHLQDKLDEAQFFLQSLYRRKDTIRRVMESVIEFQREFFDKGKFSDLRPLISRQVADAIDMNESTVRRVLKNKYVDTPYGVFSLDFFFDGVGFSSHDGKKTASKGVKEIVRDIIQSEEKGRPYLDQEISDILKKEFGIEVQRRVVMKYRESMGFLPARLRRMPF